MGHLEKPVAGGVDGKRSYSARGIVLMLVAAALVASQWTTIAQRLPPALVKRLPRAMRPRPTYTPVWPSGWADEMWHEAYTPVKPRFQLLTYRETLIAGLTWIYGAPVRPIDFDDARLGARLTVFPPGGGPELTVRLEMFIDPDGEASVEVEGPLGGRTLRRISLGEPALALDAGDRRILPATATSARLSSKPQPERVAPRLSWQTMASRSRRAELGGPVSNETISCTSTSRCWPARVLTAGTRTS